MLSSQIDHCYNFLADQQEGADPNQKAALIYNFVHDIVLERKKAEIMDIGKVVAEKEILEDQVTFLKDQTHWLEYQLKD